MDLLLTILIILTIAYAAAILVCLLGLNRLSPAKTADNPMVSVVVAARNEECNIANLINALIAQDYAKDKYEIIIVNDGSTDSTVQIIQNISNKYRKPEIKRLDVLNRDRVVSPKKQAISWGIEQAAGDILLLTDADCVPPPSWISGIVAYFTPHTDMVIGFSPYELPALQGPGDYWMALESLSLGAIAAGSTGWGYPLTCNGRNLAYRKTVWYGVGGFEKIKNFVSGDDDLFLKMVRQSKRFNITFASNRVTVVPTRKLDHFRQFVQQRIRHASKAFHYGWKMTSILSIIYLYNLLMLALLLSSPALKDLGLVWGLFLFKSVAEFILLAAFAKKMERMHFLVVFPLTAILHLVYVVIMGALGQFVKFKWKENTAQNDNYKIPPNQGERL